MLWTTTREEQRKNFQLYLPRLNPFLKKLARAAVAGPRNDAAQVALVRDRPAERDQLAGDPNDALPHAFRDFARILLGLHANASISMS